ncbi:MAG: GNAT family N-acetyltransferase [Dehalococcoidales bacterium]
MANSNGDVKTRRMVDDDLMKVKQIDRLLFGEERVTTWPFSFETYWEIYGPGVIFVAELAGEVVGFIAGNISEQARDQSILDLMHTIARSARYPKIGWIDMIGILPGSQGKHVGQALVNAFQVECQQHGAPMRAIIKEGDARLTGFLERMGFKKWETVTYEKE